jgi:hypothetical protein
MEFRWGTLKQVTHDSKLKYFPLCINVDLHAYRKKTQDEQERKKSFSLKTLCIF